MLSFHTNPSFRRSSKNRDSHRGHSYEKLEERRMLAANIELVDVYLVDGNLNRITAPVHGERIGIRADWNTTDLPPDAVYKIGFYVDGVELLSGESTSGAGRSTGSGWWYRTRWYASGELQNVTVIADVLDDVAESTDADNTMTFSFTSQSPTDLPQKLIWPMEAAPYSGIRVSNYVDVDPTSGIRDYAGGNASYDGHSAFDTGPGHFQYMDAGYELFAAADGVVSYVHDGEFDRQTSWIDGAIGNAVRIDHGNGWTTFYWHLRRDSVNVKVGQEVSQGDVLGLMGSSGISSGMHVHFGLQRHGRAVEPMYAESDYFISPFGNVFDNRYLNNSIVTNYWNGNHRKEGFSTVDAYDQSSNQRSQTYVQFSGLQEDDLIEFMWYRPNGSLYNTRSGTQSQNNSAGAWYYSTLLPDTPDLGAWRIEFRVNGVVLGENGFEVTENGAPEIRIEDVDGDLIVDGRYTPLDFGTSNLDSIAEEITLEVINHGSDTLELGDLQLPANFNLVEGLPVSLEAGQRDSFTIAIDSSNPGFHAGVVRLDSNDADESIYSFSVEGFVDDGSEQLFLGISERSIDQSTAMVANVRRPGITTGQTTVNLTTNASLWLDLPASVVIPAGEEYVSFEIQALDEGQWDGDVIARVHANSPGFSQATNSFDILDQLAAPEVVGRNLVYDNSSFDGYEPGSGVSDDMAISGKSALLPGEVATFENYTSYLNGINSIVIDTTAFPDVAGLDSTDFVFRTGNGSDNSDFTDLAVVPTVSVRAGEGANGSDRVTLSFADGEITKTWLQVTVLANAKTGLGQNDVFYFGNAIGETGNDPANAVVNLADVSLTRTNQSGFSTVGLESNYDFDRDGRVNLADVAHARENQSGFTPLRLITAPDGEAQSRSANPIKGKDGGQKSFSGSIEGLAANETDSIGNSGFESTFESSLNESHDHIHGAIDSSFEELTGIDSENGFGSDPYVAGESPSAGMPASLVSDIGEDSHREQSLSLAVTENRPRQIESDHFILAGDQDLIELINFL